MFRAVLLSIVLNLAAGQTASLLCKAWCHDATPARCLHEESTASSMVTADDRCEDAGVVMVAFVQEDARRDPAAPDAQNAPAIARFRPAPSPADPPFGVEWERRRLEKRPLIISLRI